MSGKRPDPDPEVTYVCWQGFASDTPHIGLAVRRSQAFPGGSEIVKAHRAMFVPAGQPLPSIDPFVAGLPVNERVDPYEAKVLKPLRPEDTLICTRQVQSGAVWIPVGSRIDRRHFAVQGSQGTSAR